MSFAGGVTAKVDSVSATYITATVPAGALSGPVTITTAGGKLKSDRNFLVTPQVKGITPASGVVGTKVTFAGVAASFKVVNDATMDALVPSGAVSGTIDITTPGGEAISKTRFTVN